MPLQNDSPRLLVSIEETQKITGLGRTKVYELLGDNSLQSVKVGKRNLVLYKSIADWIEQLTNQKR